MKIIFILLLSLPHGAAAEIFAAKGFQLELKKIEAAKGKRSLEPLYLRAQELCDELSDGAPTMKAEDYQAAAARFKGLELGTVEVPGAWIRPDHFFELAQKKGRKADIEFFALLRAEKRSGGWDVYSSSHTAFLGCNTVGSGVFVKMYGRWKAFHEKRPENYSDAAEEAMQKIEDALKQTTCVCGDRDKALAEFESFLKAYPDILGADDLQDRIDKIKGKTTGIKFECKPS